MRNTDSIANEEVKAPGYAKWNERNALEENWFETVDYAGSSRAVVLLDIPSKITAVRPVLFWLIAHRWMEFKPSSLLCLDSCRYRLEVGYTSVKKVAHLALHCPFSSWEKKKKKPATGGEEMPRASIGRSATLGGVRAAGIVFVSPAPLNARTREGRAAQDVQQDKLWSPSLLNTAQQLAASC